jgi:LytS/YehU family sensor histidine kinase
MKEAHASLATLHEHMDEHAKALEHYRTYHTLSDSLMNAGVSSEMSELRLRYDTEHRDRENAELRAQQELADLRAARNRWIAIGIGVIAIAIAAIAWAMAQRNRQRAYQREAELEQQALRLQMDPHFLFNALNTIPGLYATGDAVLANDHVGHLSKYLRAVLETSRRRTIPLAQEIELVKHYLQISANRRSGQFTWTLKVMPYVRPERVAVPPMLVQPLVENALEHAFPGGRKGHVQVLFDQAGSVLHIEVSDNGVGREAAAKQPSRRGTTSLGLDLVRRRVELFDQQANLSDAVRVTDLRNTDGTPNGTTIILRMRVRNLDEHAAAGDRG